VLFYSFDTNSYKRFIGSGQDGVGHLIGLASTNDTLYIADFASTDGFPGGAGVVYELTSTVPEPATVALAFIGIAACGMRRRKNWGRRGFSPAPGQRGLKLGAD
jgi:hypothetical protein